MDPRILTFYLLLIANIFTYIYCSTINRNRNQIVELQSLRDLIASSQLRINSERSLASKPRNPFLRLEEPLKSKLEPRWTNPCNKHSFNDTLIRIIISPQNYYPTHLIESERKERGRFLRDALMNLREHNLSLINKAGLSLAKIAAASSTTESEQTERTKRSVITFKKVTREDSKWSANSAQFPNDLSSDEKNEILLKKPKKGAKKTTFSSIDKSYSKNRIKSREYHSLSLDGQTPLKYGPIASLSTNKHESSIITSPKMTDSGTTTPTTTSNLTYHDTQEDFEIKESTLNIKVLQSNGFEVDELLKKIFADDIKIYWYLNRALNSMNKAKRITKNIKRSLDEDLKDKNIKEKRFEEILKQRGDWLPNLEDLLTTNQQLIKQSESRQILANVSYYIQFFSCAFEQMIYEQVTLDKKYVKAYRELEKATLRVLCDIDTLIIHLEKFNYNKVEYINEIRNLTSQFNLDGEGVSILKRTVSETDTGFDTNNRGVISSATIDSQPSPTTNSSRYQQVNETKSLNSPPRKRDLMSFSPAGIPAVKREVMPISQRNLNSSLERAVRDRSILIEFEKLLTYYQSLLTNIYI